MEFVYELLYGKSGEIERFPEEEKVIFTLSEVDFDRVKKEIHAFMDKQSVKYVAVSPEEENKIHEVDFIRMNIGGLDVTFNKQSNDKK